MGRGTALRRVQAAGCVSQEEATGGAWGGTPPACGQLFGLSGMGLAGCWGRVGGWHWGGDQGRMVLRQAPAAGCGAARGKQRWSRGAEPGCAGSGCPSLPAL
jgi:hypothetical protein